MSGTVKLSDEQVRQILAFSEIQKLITNDALAAEFGASKWHIQAIRQGKKRVQIDPPQIDLATVRGWLALLSPNTGSARNLRSLQAGCGKSSNEPTDVSESSRTLSGGRG